MCAVFPLLPQLVGQEPTREVPKLKRFRKCHAWLETCSEAQYGLYLVFI